MRGRLSGVGERPETTRAKSCRETAETLANTPAVTRSSYVHPLVVEAFEDEAAAILNADRPTRKRLDRAETALMRLLEEEFPADAGGA